MQRDATRRAVFQLTALVTALARLARRKTRRILWLALLLVTLSLTTESSILPIPASATPSPTEPTRDRSSVPTISAVGEGVGVSAASRDTARSAPDIPEPTRSSSPGNGVGMIAGAVL